MTSTVGRIDLRPALEAAIRAPSMHNSQPWRFRIEGNAVLVIADPSRGLPVADAGGWGTRIACGAAALNLRLAMEAMDHQALISWRPDRTG